MINKKLGPLSLWFFRRFLKHQEILHFISDRKGGVSKPPFNSLNLSFNVGDDPQKVMENRKILASTLNFKPANIVNCEQVHGGRVVVIRKHINRKDKQKTQQGLTIKGADGLLTDVSDLCLMVLVADCLVLLFYDPQNEVIGAVHAGWKGTLEKISEKAIKTMKEVYGSNPHNIIVGISPSIGPCCYEVKSDVLERFQREVLYQKGVIERRNKRYYLNLWQANKIQLLRSGVLEKNIEISKICSKCYKEFFFSVRGNKKTGRFASGIMKRT